MLWTDVKVVSNSANQKISAKRIYGRSNKPTEHQRPNRRSNEGQANSCYGSSDDHNNVKRVKSLEAQFALKQRTARRAQAQDHDAYRSDRDGTHQDRRIIDAREGNCGS